MTAAIALQSKGRPSVGKSPTPSSEVNMPSEMTLLWVSIAVNLSAASTWYALVGMPQVGALFPLVPFIAWLAREAYG